MTIEKLINILKEFNPEKEICIQDADTGWLLNITEINDWDKEITYLAGQYSKTKEVV